MKFLLLIILVLATQTADLNKLGWLNGKWVRTNAKPGRTGYETWKTTGATTMIGAGINMKGADTTFVEKIRIEIKEGKLFYVADVPENKSEVWFEFTKLTDKGFVVENPKHDFPKKIAYEVDGKKLKATISGDGKSIDYLFTKE